MESPTEQLAVAAAVTGAATAVLLYAKGRRGLRTMVLGADCRASTSKTVAFLWGVVISWMLISMLILAPLSEPAELRTYIGSIGQLPDSYYLLLGGPFTAAVLARAIVVKRIDEGTLEKPPGDGRLRLSDLTSDDQQQTDPSDLQYMLFNLVALAYVIVLFSRDPHAGPPSLPEAVFGLASGSVVAYLGNKQVQDRRPRSETAPAGVPEQTDNSERSVDPDQDVSQDPAVDYAQEIR